VVNAGVFVLLQVRKLFLSHVHHDCGSSFEQDRGFDEREMHGVVWSGVMSWQWISSCREMFETLEDAPPRHSRHFTLFGPQLVKKGLNRGFKLHMFHDHRSMVLPNLIHCHCDPSFKARQHKIWSSILYPPWAQVGLPWLVTTHIGDPIDRLACRR
jgi:hypothetical protein